MQQFSNTHGDLLVVNRGEEVMSKLMDYAREHNLKSAWVSGLGGTGATTLGFYNIETKEYEWTDYPKPMEIMNLTGNLSWVEGEPFWHVHGTFSGRDLQAVGGHVNRLVVGLTCELLITPLEAPLTRSFDDDTGLKLLSPQKD